MRVSINLLLVLILVGVSATFANDPIWLEKMKQIRVMSDGKDDVLKTMGSPIHDNVKSHVWYYDFDEGRLSVMYSTGICGSFEGKPVGWNVPEWRVIEVNFSFEEPIKPKKLGINFKGFAMNPMREERNGIEYINEDMGIEYIVYDGKVHGITFSPSNKFDDLLCK